MRLQLNRLIPLLLAISGPAAADVSDGFLQDIETCLTHVRFAQSARGELGATDREIAVDGELRSGVFFQSEARDGVEVNICKSVNVFVRDGLPDGLATEIRVLADRADLIELRLKSPGLFFADCQNAPRARYGLAVTPRDDGWGFQAVKSPAVGGPCGHSYGLH